jgi:hypothetical protein
MDDIKNEIDAFLCNSLKNDSHVKMNVKQMVQIDYSKLYHGQLIWHMLHSLSVFYPHEPTIDHKNDAKFLIENAKSLLFCSSCSRNPHDNFYELYDLDLAVSCKMEMVKYFIEYHKFINSNIPNKIYNGEPFTIDYVINKYTNQDYINYFKQVHDFNIEELMTSDKDNFHKAVLKFKNNFTSHIKKRELNVIDMNLVITTK